MLSEKEYLLEICTDGDCLVAFEGKTYGYMLEVVIPRGDLREIASRIADFLNEVHVVDGGGYAEEMRSIINRSLQYFRTGYFNELEWHLGGNRYVSVSGLPPRIPLP